MIEKAKKSSAGELAHLHTSALHGELLTKLGFDFLIRLYDEAIVDRETHILLHRTNDVAEGFIFFCKKPGVFYSHLIRRNVLFFTTKALQAIKRDPDTFSQMVSTLKHMVFSDKESAHEILVLVVNPEIQRRGVGTRLLKSLENILAQEHVKMYNVKTTSENAKSNNFYRKNGFKVLRLFNMQNREWVEYTKKI